MSKMLMHRQNMKKLLRSILWLLVFALTVGFPRGIPAEAYLFVNKVYEQRVGDEYARRFESQVEIVRGQNLNRAYAEVVETLWGHFKPNADYRFRVVDDGTLNAFSIPGGHTYVTWKMMNFVGSYDELAFVISHEIGHQQREHFLREVDGALTTQAGFALLGVALKQERLADVARQIVARSAMRGFGFKKEFEADEYGFELMTKAGYHPSAGALFFYNLRKNYGEGEANDPRQSGYLSPHPANSKRIARQLELLRAYSRDKVSVFGNQVIINGAPVVSTIAHNRFSAEERAYFVAGSIAQAFHNEPCPAFLLSEDQRSIISTGGRTVYVNIEGVNMDSLMRRLNGR